MTSVVVNYVSWVVLWRLAKYPDSGISGYQVDLQTVLNTRLPKPILYFCYQHLASGQLGLKKVKLHGMGIHTFKEVIESGKSSLRVLSDILCDKPLMVNEITLLDVVAFANLTQLHFISQGVEYPMPFRACHTYPYFSGKGCACIEWDAMAATYGNTASSSVEDDLKKMHEEEKKATGPAKKKKKSRGHKAQGKKYGKENRQQE